MFARLYHPLILRGACLRTCKCTCRCLTTGERLNFLELLLRTNQRNMSNTRSNGGASSSAKLTTKGHNRVGCIFCRIVDGKEPKSEDKILFQDEEFVVFPDIKPAAKHHLLVVTKEHISDAKALTPSQGGLLQRMVDTGKKVLTDRLKSELQTASSGVTDEETIGNALLGFHWPPFHTVAHLHLHVIAPANEIGFVGRLIFRPNSYWFVQPSWVKERLDRTKTIQDPTSSQ